MIWLAGYIIVTILSFCLVVRVLNSHTIEWVHKCNDIVSRISVGDLVCKSDSWETETGDYDYEYEYFYVRSIMMGHVSICGTNATYPSLKVESVGDRKKVRSIEVDSSYASGRIHFSTLTVIRNPEEKKKIERKYSKL